MMPVLDDDDISLQSVIASRAGSIVGFPCLRGSGSRNRQAKYQSGLSFRVHAPSQACALLVREDDQAPRSFSELARYFAFAWRYR